MLSSICACGRLVTFDVWQLRAGKRTRRQSIENGLRLVGCCGAWVQDLIPQPRDAHVWHRYDKTLWPSEAAGSADSSGSRQADRDAVRSRLATFLEDELVAASPAN